MSVANTCSITPTRQRCPSICLSSSVVTVGPLTYSIVLERKYFNTSLPTSVQHCNISANNYLVFFWSDKSIYSNSIARLVAHYTFLCLFGILHCHLLLHLQLLLLHLLCLFYYMAFICITNWVVWYINFLARYSAVCSELINGFITSGPNAPCTNSKYLLTDVISWLC